MRMWRRLVVFLTAGSALCLLTGWGPAVRDPGSGLTLDSYHAAFLKFDAVPAVVAPVVDLVDGPTGARLYSMAAFEHHAIGSLTKLMTALLAVHRLALSRVVTVSGKAASTPGSTMYLMRGDRLSVRSLLYGLLLPSGNDAAEELAETMAGNDKRFASLANRQAAAYGLLCSHYVTPHGLDAKGEYSCAVDVAALSRIVLGTRLLAHIVRTKQITVRGLGQGEVFPLANTNLLLGTYPGIIGVKTGTTDQAGGSLSAADRRDGHTLICVVLGSTDFGRFSDCAALLTFAFRDFVWPLEVNTMWSTQSLENGGAQAEYAPIPRWESTWARVIQGGLVTVPFDSHR